MRIIAFAHVNVVEECTNLRENSRLPGFESMESVKKLANQTDIAYGRPPNPNSKNYDQQVSAFEKKVARAKQVHTCEYRRCLVPSKNGSMRCKRRAPFPRADEDFITETGDWGMKRLFEYMNAWCPTPRPPPICPSFANNLVPGRFAQSTALTHFSVGQYD